MTNRGIRVAPLGATGLEVTNLAIGTSALASMPRVYGYEVSRDRALETLRRALDSPVNLVDTSNGYADGNAERLIGEVLRERGGLPPGSLVSTKVDPDELGDFSGARVLRSVEESCERLGMDSYRSCSYTTRSGSPSRRRWRQPGPYRRWSG